MLPSRSQGPLHPISSSDCLAAYQMLVGVDRAGMMLRLLVHDDEGFASLPPVERYAGFLRDDNMSEDLLSPKPPALSASGPR